MFESYNPLFPRSASNRGLFSSSHNPAADLLSPSIVSTPHYITAAALLSLPHRHHLNYTENMSTASVGRRPPGRASELMSHPVIRGALPFLNGGAAGMMATTIIQPVDMVKVSSSHLPPTMDSSNQQNTRPNHINAPSRSVSNSLARVSQAPPPGPPPSPSPAKSSPLAGSSTSTLVSPPVSFVKPSTPPRVWASSAPSCPKFRRGQRPPHGP